MELLVNIDQRISPHYRVVIRVMKIPVSKLYPDGIKTRFVLIDMFTKKPKILIDNHEPFGFHSHEEPESKTSKRISLPVQEYKQAMTIFFEKVEEVLKNEK